MIIPYEFEANFINLANIKMLYCNKLLRVRGKKNGDIKRSLMMFSFEKKLVKIDELYLEEKRHNYSNAYICLLYTSSSPRDGLLSRMPSSA